MTLRMLLGLCNVLLSGFAAAADPTDCEAMVMTTADGAVDTCDLQACQAACGDGCRKGCVVFTSTPAPSQLR